MNDNPIKQILHKYGFCSDTSLHKYIIPHSVPVFYFGDHSAPVATIGINCGPEEFDPSNILAQHWGKKHHIHASNYMHHIDEIVDHFDTYFTHPHSCQKKFWSKWESLLHLADVSYHNPHMTSAFHFDLVPWVTDPIWGNISSEDQAAFLQSSQEGRDQFFHSTSAKIFLCQGKTATEITGPLLGFWDQNVPWFRIGKSKFVVQKHPTKEKWLIGWNRWYYSNDDKNVIAQYLSSILKNQTITHPKIEPISHSKIPVIPQKNTPKHIETLQMNRDNISDVMQQVIDVFIDLASTCWSGVEFQIHETNQWNGVFTTTHKKRKLLTLFKNMSDIEFSRACIMPEERNILHEHVNIKDTWHTSSVPQVRISGISAEILQDFEEIFCKIFERILQEHPHYIRPKKSIAMI